MRPEQKLRIAWVGFHQEGIPTLRWLRNSGIRLEAILTLDEPALAKRSAGGGYEDVTADWDVPVFRISSINDPEVVQLLHRLSLDLVFVIHGCIHWLHCECIKELHLRLAVKLDIHKAVDLGSKDHLIVVSEEAGLIGHDH